MSTRSPGRSIGRRISSTTFSHNRSIPSTPRIWRTRGTATRGATTIGATTLRLDRSRSRVEGGSSELHTVPPPPRSRRACSGPLLERSSRGSRSNHRRPREGHRLEEGDRALTGAPRQTDHRTSRIRGRPLGADHHLRLSSESSSGGRRSRVARDDLIENFFAAEGAVKSLESFRSGVAHGGPTPPSPTFKNRKRESFSTNLSRMRKT